MSTTVEGDDIELEIARMRAHIRLLRRALASFGEAAEFRRALREDIEDLANDLEAAERRFTAAGPALLAQILATAEADGRRLPVAVIAEVACPDCGASSGRVCRNKQTREGLQYAHYHAGRRSEAFAALRRAVELGYPDVTSMLAAGDLWSDEMEDLDNRLSRAD